MRTCLWMVAAGFALLAVSCKAVHYEQGGLSFGFARVQLPNNGAFAITGGKIHSDRGPITRFVYQVGKDVNGDGKLDAADGDLLLEIDNPNASPSVVIADVTGNIGKGETWIVNMKVYQGGDTPVVSKSWTNKN